MEEVREVKNPEPREYEEDQKVDEQKELHRKENIIGKLRFS